MIASIALLFSLSMANVFVFVISAPHHVISKPIIWKLDFDCNKFKQQLGTKVDQVKSYPMGHMAKVEAELDEYVQSNYHETSKLHDAIKELKEIKPKSEVVEKLLADLSAVGNSVKLGEKPKKMELFEECLKMFAPLKESRQMLKELQNKIGSIERTYSCYYIPQTKEYLRKEMEGAIEYFDEHKTAMLEEVQQKGYIKSEKALEEMANAFDKLNSGEIIKWVGLAKEEMLREVFGLYGILEKYPV